jgi:hypothetical protein
LVEFVSMRLENRWRVTYSVPVPSKATTDDDLMIVNYAGR